MPIPQSTIPSRHKKTRHIAGSQNSLWYATKNYKVFTKMNKRIYFTLLTRIGIISYFTPISLSNHLNGDEGIRTPDLLRAREALSQLSYIPAHKSGPE
jgi:hypothetical protein